MVHDRRALVWITILFLMTISLTACGPEENREASRPAVVPASSRDAVINERLSALQNRIAQLDHQISQATVTSRQLNEEITALRQELAAGTAARPAEAPAPVPQAAATPAPAIAAPQPTTQPVITQPAPPVPLAPMAPAATPPSHNPMFWIVILAILFVALYFIIKLLMGPWSEEEDSDWIEEGGPADEEDTISLSPETSEKPDTETQEPGDEPKP